MIVKTEAVNVDEFFVAGITVRTINNGQSRHDMTALWEKFARDPVFRKLENKVSNDIYCVYTEFETDHTGHYTAILGCKVKSLALVPDGFTGIVIPEDNYLVYHLAGKCPQMYWKRGSRYGLSMSTGSTLLILIGIVPISKVSRIVKCGSICR